MSPGLWWRWADGVERWLPRGTLPAWDGEAGAPLDISALVPRSVDARPPRQGPARTAAIYAASSPSSATNDDNRK